jgi:hypothetical protein
MRGLEETEEEKRRGGEIASRKNNHINSFHPLSKG